MSRFFLCLLFATQLIAESKMGPLEAVLQGRIDFFRAAAVHSPVPGADYQERTDNTLYVWGVYSAPVNGVMERDIARMLPEEEIDATVAFFQEKNLPFIWWSSSKNLETKGFQSGGILSGIALDLTKGLPAYSEVPEGLEIRKVESEEDLLAFSHLMGEEFGVPKNEVGHYFEINRGSLKEQVHFLATLNGVPAGTATLSTGPVAGGIWNLATRADMRKRGVASAIVHACLVEAKKRGCPYAMAILMPKGLARGVFEKLGFTEACQFPFYIYGASPDQLEK